MATSENPPSLNEAPNTQKTEALIQMIQSLPPAEKKTILALAADLTEKPEPRMVKTMVRVAEILGLEWRDDAPAGHPYGAQLDGQLWMSGKRIAVVELEARTPKQIRGALLDLIAHPEKGKILVIGNSKAGRASVAKKAITDRVIPALRNLITLTANLAVFTEDDLRENPQVLKDYLATSMKTQR